MGYDDVAIVASHADVEPPASAVYGKIYILASDQKFYVKKSDNTVYSIGPSAAGLASVTGFNVNNTDPLNPVILALQVDGVTITGTGALGNPLVAAPASILTGNTIWVDDVNGNNGTGTRGRQDLPFLTISAAQAVAVSGDMIVIRPGTYAATNLGADGVRFHFEDGAVVTAAGNMWTNVGAISYSVTGDGYFTSSAAVLFTNAVAGSTIYFECKYAAGTGNGSRTIWLFGDADVTMNIKTDLVLSGWETVVRIDGPTARLNLTCDRMIGVGGLINFSGGTTGATLCTATARQFIYNAAGVFPAGGYVGIDPGDAVLKMYGDVYFNGNGVYGLPAMYMGGAGIVEIYGNIYSTSTDGTVNAFGTVKLDVHGDITTSGTLVTSGAGAIVHYYGKIVSSVANAVTHTTGKTIIHDMVKATAGNGISVAAAGLILRQDAVIVATGDSVTAGAAQTIKTYPGAVANTAVNVNITESVSTLLVSALVDAE